MSEEKSNTTTKQEEPIKEEEPAKANIPIVDAYIKNLFKEKSDKQTYDNMVFLTNKKAFKIGDKIYSRKILKPIELVEFSKLQYELIKLGDTEDIEKKLDLLEKIGILSLEGFTKEDYENCDILKLEQVIAALFLISKGFCEVAD